MEIESDGISRGNPAVSLNLRPSVRGPGRFRYQTFHGALFCGTAAGESIVNVGWFLFLLHPMNIYALVAGYKFRSRQIFPMRLDMDLECIRNIYCTVHPRDFLMWSCSSDDIHLGKMPLSFSCVLFTGDF